jgi:hypothetical protein
MGLRVPAERGSLVWYVTLGGLAAVELIDWPVAAVMAIGHIVEKNSRSAEGRAFGDAMEQA